MRNRRSVTDVRFLKFLADAEQQVLVGATLPHLSRKCRLSQTPVVLRLRRFRKSGWVRPVYNGYVLTESGKAHLASLENGSGKR